MNNEPGDNRTADAVVAWLLYALQLVGELGLSALWLTAVMMTDGCGSTADDAAVCNAAYFFAGWVGFAAVLVAAALATPVGIIVAGKRGSRRWKWPVIVIAILLVATVTFVWAFTR